MMESLGTSVHVKHSDGMWIKINTEKQLELRLERYITSHGQGPGLFLPLNTCIVIIFLGVWYFILPVAAACPCAVLLHLIPTRLLGLFGAQ